MQETANFINIAKSLSELGVTGLLALSNITWFFISRMLWRELKSMEGKFQQCLRNR